MTMMLVMIFCTRPMTDTCATSENLQQPCGLRLMMIRRRIMLVIMVQMIVIMVMILINDHGDNGLLICPGRQQAKLESKLFCFFFCLLFWCIDIHSGFEKVNVFLSGEEEKQKVRVRRGKVQQVSFTLKIKKGITSEYLWFEENCFILSSSFLLPRFCIFSRCCQEIPCC